MLSRASYQQTAKTQSIPAPIKGLNARDALANMDPSFALMLDNCFCTPTDVGVRQGSTQWATGLPGWAETVFHWAGGQFNKRFAASGGNIYDVTNTGPVAAPVHTGSTTNRWQWTNFATPGGQYVVMVNGTDNELLYDGTNWTNVTSTSTPAITGIATTSLINVVAYKSRLWYVERNSLRAWYLPLNSIGGAATVFDLSSIFSGGGYLVAMATWSVENSSNVQQYLVFMTSEGEVAVYQGIDPSFAATFSIVGQFKMGRPAGPRCFVPIASDLAVICADGLVQLSSELLSDREQSQALTYNIQNAINNDVQAFINNFGWQPLLYSVGNKILLNVPAVENNTSYQYVMNTLTGAWSTWNKYAVGFNICCMDVSTDQLFAGGNGVVYQLDVGQSDSGANINAVIKPAFSYFGNLGQEKMFTLARPIFTSDNGAIFPSYALCLDYADATFAPPVTSMGESSPWDTSPWDTSPWAGAGQITKQWTGGVTGIGYSAALKIGLATNGTSASLQSIDYVFEPGGVL